MFGALHIALSAYRSTGILKRSPWKGMMVISLTQFQSNIQMWNTLCHSRFWESLTVRMPKIISRQPMTICTWKRLCSCKGFSWTKKHTWQESSCCVYLRMFCWAKSHTLYNEERMGAISILKSPMRMMFTQQTWVVLTKLTSFTHFIPLVIPLENGIGTFFGFYSAFQSAMGSFMNQFFILPMEKESAWWSALYLIWRKKLINGFSQRKRRQRSQEAQSRSVAREEHKSVHAEGRKRKCVQWQRHL